MASTALTRVRSLIHPLSARSAGATWFGWAMALTSTFAFSIAPVIAKAAIQSGIAPNALLAIRLFVSTLLLGGTLALTAPHRLRINRRATFICGLAGLANGLGMLTYFWALARVEASITSMIFSLSPLAVLGLLALRGENLTRRHFMRLALGLSGVYLLIGLGSGSGSPIDWLGVLFVVITIFTFAIHLVLIQWFLQDYDARTVTFYVVLTMTLVSAIFWLGQGAPWQRPGWSGWLAIIVLAVVSTYAARLTLFAAVRHLGSSQIALMLPLETLLAVVWAVMFLHERLTPWQWLGGGLIIASTLLAANRLRWTQRRLRWRIWWRP